MPNWVYTSIAISGSKEQIAQFKEQAGKSHPDSWDEATNSVVMKSDDLISFWNFVAPPDEIVFSGEYFGTSGWENGERKGDTPTNWYNWNNDNWDTKWDACNPEIFIDEPTSLTYTFETAWSPATPVFEKMVEQFPDLYFDIHWEEEQGFGAELANIGGELTITREWDIPNSHADYVAQDKEDTCMCGTYGDESEWYEDCPRELRADEQPEPDVVY
jgi:hypothetical protein